MKIAFDNDKYIRIQSEHIRERIAQFGNKLYQFFCFGNFIHSDKNFFILFLNLF